MNKLELCQRLLIEGVSSGLIISTTENQTRLLAKAVVWIDTANEDIQSTSANFEFLRESFTFNTEATTSTYTPTDAGLTDFASWRVASNRALSAYTGTGDDEQWLTDYGWDEFREIKLFGSSRSQTGQPVDFAVMPNKSLVLWPIPSSIYTISGEYFKNPQKLTEDTSTPPFPWRFHMAIVWRALMLFAAEQGATVAYQHGLKEFNKIYSKLENDQTPTTGSYVGALA